MIRVHELEKQKIRDIENKYPFVLSFFENNKLDIKDYQENTLEEYFDSFAQEDIEEWAIDIPKLKSGLAAFINQMLEFLGLEKDRVDYITIIAGKDKYGNRENFDELVVRKGEIVSIVGPTGSGKSRLLADIEWAANKDTPTDRIILINGEIPDKNIRFSTSNKLVAQLSQNMNFIMDLSVREFLELHAKSRMVDNEAEVIRKIIDAANELAGEKFDLDTPVTRLSGGQSRALMIADTAILSASPIVLIDEIENAGIDRKRALNLLVNEDKIVLMATHDPSLALMATKRIVIRNGGVYKVINTGKEEKMILVELEKMDRIINDMRSKLREGQILESI
ncbi:ATP-binding cassette domain-containing protein [Parasporobacterium paucivorans]|uniref:ABC-type lipoprotein export system, ATPase component n=1 Tax=Parasporobacterium paucivorans DSM 15970 TaxID=1122934 RepID=A0A1M6L9W9_9FIRM|nr:ATP-binding cassette domain-containing protein [Parasporobacterium paucivorans]SHJ67964.1 ABC-type lipoprotein export system, ATPase component [Parasporobacterium paucivorans DSM 15970]